ncbi:S8 family serine peptidase [Luteolibacter soli]|uniref:S8 family serine peptidase n=1 Tax=Luteolibacter soli TaxID=3135280 RepID=A0ABU9B4F5_9BACT
MSHRSRRISGLLLLATVTGILLVPRDDHGDKSTAAAAEPSKAPREKSTIPEAPVVPEPPAAVVTADRGSERTFDIALDEAVFRDADGKDVTLRLDPPATLATLPARLIELSSQGEVLPVCYEPGKPHTPQYRRIITRDITVELPSPDAAPALPQGVVLKDRPAYAPGYAIVSAADPFAAIAALEPLRNQPGIVSADIQLASQRALKSMPNDPLIGDQWHLKNSNSARTHANVENAWLYGGSGGVKGTGIRIGVVDDGLQTAHPDLAANVDTTNDKDWNGNDADPNPGSGDDHGTACAGNAAARGNNALGVSGTAPEATLVGMRLIAAATTDAQEAEAMAYLPDLIQVKTNSWGPNDDGATLEGPGALTKAALATATSSGRGGLGTIILWAGGNGGDVLDNSNYDGYANDIHTIAIAATDSEGGQSWYSEPGANIVVSAPSSGDVLGITTVDRTGSNGYNTAASPTGDYTNDFGGTSSATPTAAGIVALMLEKKPTLGWRDVQEILIRSAYKFAPTDSDWTDNGAGFHFNHKFGAGLIDATAAVNMASTWTNLAAATSQTVSQSGLSVSVPDNNATGITRSFAFSGANLRVEQATVTLTANHANRGELEVTLTSPSGTVSRLAEKHNDGASNYTDWTFSSVRHWGENSAGTWTLKIADRTSGTTGTLSAASITLNGALGTPINPGPTVQITSPADGAVFSPGATFNVDVAASDLTSTGSAGTVSSVQLLDNGSPVATDTTSPFSFSFSPALGSHSLTAIATDSEGKATTSGAVAISVINQPPVITAASLAPSPQAFSDEVIAVTGLTASDPESQSLTYSYAWEKSSDSVTWTAAGVTTASLPAAAGNAGFLWRCKITASDGTSSSVAFTTTAVNSLVRPPSSVANGSPFSYDSGLVLRGTDSPVSRDALINEFSQGVSGTSEWVEILTLRETSFRQWKYADSNSGTLTFADAAVWDAIPAGTLIVIYNGAAKDSLLPADDTDASDKKLVLASNNATYFSGSWPALGNSGDAVLLKNAAGTTVAGVSYGSSNAATPHLGGVSGGSAAYFGGGSDAAADTVGAWTVTTSAVARRITRAVGDLFMSEYMEGSTGNNKFLEIYNPSASAVDLGTAGYKVEIYANGASGATSTISLTGTIAAGGTHVIKNSGASLAVTAQTSSANLSFNGDDAVVLKKGTAIVDCIGQVGVDPGTAWTGGGVSTLDKTIRRKPSILTGDTNSTDVFDPSIEWVQIGTDIIDGFGSHTVDGGGGSGPSVTVSVSPASFAENAGASAATGTVTLSAAPAADVVVSLLSSDTGAATVPVSVTVLAGQTTATFAVAAIDDAVADGPQTSAISATASGYTAGNFVVTATDNEASLDGVTPGGGNTPANVAFIADIRSGALNAPALFRFGATSQTPANLTIDSATGVVSGTLSAAPGDYLIVIERYNTLAEVVSQSFTLTVTGSGGYAGWIAGYPGLSSSAMDGDPDFDGMANVLEYYLGANPGTPDASASLPVFAKSGTTLTLTWWHLKSATDVSGAVEWSDSLGSWFNSGISTQVIADEATREQIRATLNVGPGEVKKFLHLKVE